jgi:acetyl-CoA carboxylase biotin carboxyl carrier protein
MDISEIKELTEFFSQMDIQSFKLTQGDFSIELKKESSSVVYYDASCSEAQPSLAAPRPVPASPQVASFPSAPPQETAAAEPVEELHTIKSPLVGTFYAAPSPERPPFVSVGAQVKKGEVVCIVEAMKVMNEIHADTDGEIAEVCVGDGSLVEFGTPLFKIR